MFVYSALGQPADHQFYVSFPETNCSASPLLYIMSQHNASLTIQMFHRNRPYDVIKKNITESEFIKVELPSDVRMSGNSVELKGISYFTFIYMYYLSVMWPWWRWPRAATYSNKKIFGFMKLKSSDAYFILKSRVCTVMISTPFHPYKAGFVK